jgi:hypothetical protein
MTADHIVGAKPWPTSRDARVTRKPIGERCARRDRGIRSFRLWEREPHGQDSRIFYFGRPFWSGRGNDRRADGITAPLPSLPAVEVLHRPRRARRLPRCPAPRGLPVPSDRWAISGRRIDPGIIFLGNDSEQRSAEVGIDEKTVRQVRKKYLHRRGER